MKNILSVIILLSFLAPAAVFPQNWNAVCAGINDYPGTANDLNWCVNDVTVMRQYLINYKQWNSDRVIRIIDGDADEDGIETAVQNMSTSAGNTNFFHFSGHGDSQELGGSDGIIPSNSIDARINQSELQTNFGSTYNQVTAFLDACGTGIFPDDMTKGVISSACEADELSYENSSIEHGYFTYYLLSGLSQSGITTAEQLHNYAAPLTTQANADQHPQIEDNFDGYLSIYNANYTLSGTLPRYETWSAQSTLQGNVYVPSNTVLTITADMDLSLNGYSITSTGGTIIVQTNATIHGALLKTGSTINAIYPTIESAIAAASSGQTVQVISSVNVSNNVSVPSGVTLYTNYDAELTFASGKRLTVYGTLNANSAVFQGNGTAGYWYAIMFYANSSGTFQSCTIKDAQAGIYCAGVTNLTISNSRITNNSLYGLSIVSSSTPTITNCSIDNNGTGISSSSSRPLISGCSFEYNTNYGITASGISQTGTHLFWTDNTWTGNGYAIFLNNASPYLHHNQIYNNYHSVLITSSYTNFADPSDDWKGYNEITCSAIPLFRAENYSSVYAGYGPSGGEDSGGYNSIFGGELPDIEAHDYTTIYACNNYFGTNFPPAAWTTNNSTILAWYQLTSDPNNSACYPTKKLANSSNTYTTEEESVLPEKYLEAISSGFKGDFYTAKSLLKSMIEDKFDSLQTPLALLSYNDFDAKDKDINGTKATFYSNDVLTSVYQREKEYPLRPFAVRLLARNAALEDNVENMIAYNTEIIENYPNSSHEVSALYDLVDYYYKIEEDEVTANKYLKKMIETYPDNDLTLCAKVNLGLASFDLEKNGETLTNEIPDHYSLSDNYPNPFNPTTTISYSIPNDEKVVLKVYDIIGSEITTLVNEEKAAGKYEVNFDASSLSSGVYIYKIQAGNFINSKKMILIK